MSEVRKTQTSFAAGEIAPHLYARTDVDKYSIALASLKNGFVHPTGGFSNRAGLKFVCEVKDSSTAVRLIPFSFNSEQTYIIEAGNEYFRYIQEGGQLVNGAAIVETATTFTSSQLFDINYAQSADILTLCHQSKAPQELSRVSNILWNIDDVAIEPTIDAPDNVTASKSGSSSASTRSYYYQVTALKEATYEESKVSEVTSAVTASVEGAWQVGEKITVSWDAVSGATEYNVYKEVNGIYAYIGNTSGVSFVDENISPDLTTTAPIYNNPFTPSIMPEMSSNSAPTGYTASISNEDGSHEAYKAFDGSDTTYAASTSLPATLIGGTTEGKVAKKCVIKPKDNAPSEYTLIGRKAGGDTVNYQTPIMTSSTVNLCTASGTIGYFNPNTGTGNIYSGETGTLIFGETAFINEINIGPIVGSSYYYATSANIKLYLDGSLVHTENVNPRDEAGTDVALGSNIECDKVIVEYGSGSSWGAGQAQPGYQFSGYTGGYTEVVLYTATEALTANTEATIDLSDNETEYTSYGITVTANTTGSTAQIIKLDFQEDGNYPACVNYFQQRRVFANTINKPNYFEASQTGLFSNFNKQRPLISTNAVTSKLFDGRMNEIKDMIATNDLVIFTAEAEWRVNGSDGTFEATPVPVAKKQSAWGSSDIMPLYIGDSILFVSAGKNKIRDFEYNYAFDKYKGNELTYLATHLFENKQIVDWAFQREPNPILWCVMSDGTLNGLTWNPEQKVLGWHHHETDGLFESVAVVREGYIDVPYFVVNRTFGEVTKRYIEYLETREITDIKDGFFVDCGLTQEFVSAVTELSGLDHLEGKTVSILADGVEVSGKVVTDGALTLDTAAQKITIGLPYDFEMQTLNVESDNTQGSVKRINSFSVKVDKSVLGFTAEGNVSGEQSYNDKDIETTSGLVSGDLRYTVNSEPSTRVYIKIKESRPYPISILSVTPSIKLTEVAEQQGQNG